VQVVERREDKFEVDPDWVPQLMGLVPDGGPLDQEVRRLDNLFRHTGCWSAVVWGHPAASGRRLGDGLAVEGSEREGSHGIAEQLAQRPAVTDATGRYSTLDSPTSLLICRRSMFAGRWKPRSPKTLAKERDDAIHRLNAAMRTRCYQHLVQLLGG
jgi:hypothetical protein